MAASTQTKKSHNGTKTESQSTSQGGAMARPRQEVMTSSRSGGTFHRFRKEVDQLFDQFIGGWARQMINRPFGWDLDVQEEEGSIKIRAEAPGFEPDDFDIQVRGDSLVLCACHQSETGETGGEGHEWSRREFFRTIPLPAGADAEHVDATYRNGILNVHVPLTEEHRPRHIPVKG
jgi:HSP20 family protein